MTINPLGGAYFGILYQSAAIVHLENVAVRNTVNRCIDVNTTANAELTVVNSTLDHCGANAGIRTITTSGIVLGDFHNLHISGSAYGIEAQNGSRVQIHNSTLALNSIGVGQDSLSGTGSVVLIFNCNFSANGTALQSTGAASMAVSSSVFGTNSVVYNPNGGQISSAGDNVQYGNPTIGTANGAPLSKI